MGSFDRSSSIENNISRVEHNLFQLLDYIKEDPQLFNNVDTISFYFYKIELIQIDELLTEELMEFLALLSEQLLSDYEDLRKYAHNLMVVDAVSRQTEDSCKKMITVLKTFWSAHASANSQGQLQYIAAPSVFIQATNYPPVYTQHLCPHCGTQMITPGGTHM